jgi:glycosyltransferase involved in cell wall biosynthesis
VVPRVASRGCVTPRLQRDVRPIRLAFLVGGLTRGGAELQMIALTERLTREGFEVDFVVRSGSGPLEPEARAAGAAIHVIGQATTARSSIQQRYGRLVGRNARWIRLARRKRYDIVDAWLHPADVVAALTRPVTGTPVVMSARLGRSPRRGAGPVSALLESTVNRLLDVVVANADVTARDAMTLQRVPSAKIRVLRGGVQLPPQFSPSERNAQRARLGAHEGDFVIGCVGNFRPMKRQDLLIEAFAGLLPGHPNLRLALIGDGDLRPGLEKQIDDLGVADRGVL